MALNARELSSARRWKAAFFASFFLGAIVLWPSLSRYADGDDAAVFYEAGTRSWGEVLTLAFVPSGWVDLPTRPQVGATPIPTAPPFVFGRWRPVSQFAYVKALWALGLSADGYRIFNWVLAWLTAFCLARGVVAVLSITKLLMPAESVWALATLLFWSAPTLFASAMSFFTVNLASLFFGLATALLCRGGRVRAPQGWEIAAAGALGFLACQSHENAWWLFGWLGALILLLKQFNQTAATAPRFWWPWVLVMAHILLFRSLLPGDGPNWTGGGAESFSLAMVVVWSRISYFLLTTLNGLSYPLVSWLGADLFPLHVTAAAFPWAFFLTVGSFGWIAYSYFRRSSKSEALWLQWVSLLTLGIGVLTFLPYCIVKYLRFIYFGKMFADFTIIAIFLLWLKAPRPRAQLLMPWLLAGALTTAFMVRNHSWLDLNANDSRNYVETVTRMYPVLKTCEPAHPCCLVAPGRTWGRNEWVLSYNLGNASQTPAFFPEGWPEARCEKFLKL